MVDSYISVSQVNNYIKSIFDSEVMLQNICVFGEIGSYNVSNGNAYFNLKDENGMLSCVLFGANRYNTIKVGDMVLVSGSISYYAKGGRLSFNAYSIMPYGRGLLFEKFLKLKSELEEKGYFDAIHKKPIPERVRRIGVVTSPTGAVIRDIIDVTHRRNNSIDIVLYPVKVQGVGAEFEIVNGINFFSNYDGVDAIIVARGGGSMEDLEPFNTEIVANATYNCSKPIISAVGHETDFTIIDFVADLRAPTPSAAAELVAWDKSQLIDNVISNINYIEKILINKLNLYKKDVLYLTNNIDNKFSTIYNKYYSDIEKNLIKLNGIDIFLDKHYNVLDKFNIKLESLNPAKISKMGYSKVFKGKQIVYSKDDVCVDDLLTISLVDGNIKATVVGE